MFPVARVVKAADSSRVRYPSKERSRWPVVWTRENSGLRSWDRPAGFQDAAVPSSETAMNALPIPAARAPDPGRLSEMSCATAAVAVVTSAAASAAAGRVTGTPPGYRLAR